MTTYSSIIYSGVEEAINSIGFNLIRTPVITSPGVNDVLTNFNPEIIGLPYAPIYDVDIRDYRQFQVDIIAGDFFCTYCR